VLEMNQAAEVEVGEAKDFCNNARLFVGHIKNYFPWVSVSQKLHILLWHAPGLLYR